MKLSIKDYLCSKYSLSTLFAFTFAFATHHTALAAPVDLSNWTSNDLGTATWTVQNAPANDSVLQSRNGNPTVYFEQGTNAQGNALSGNIKVNTGSDDDFIGFVLGYADGELGSASSDFILVDWKQANQGSAGCSGPASRGLSISRVVNSSVACSFWNHEVGSVNELRNGHEITSLCLSDSSNFTGLKNLKTGSYFVLVP